jgi:hypothetical protein
MAEDALPMINARAQLMRSKMQAHRDRKPTARSGRPILMPAQQRLSRTQLNMMPANDQLFNLAKVQENIDYAKAGIAQKMMLEAENKARLEFDRQRIRSQVQSYKLPQLMPEEMMGAEDQQTMQSVFEDEYLQQISSREFEQAALQKLEPDISQDQARVRQKKLDRAKKQATDKAKEVTQEMMQAINKARGAGKAAWDTENLISLVDTAEPADLEIPTIFTVLVQVYRACTALFNNGEKFLTGFLAFLEPEPLYRFWSPDAAQKLINAGTSDIFEGGTELENTIESMTLGWPEATVGFMAIIFIILAFASVLILIIIVFLIGVLVVTSVV